MIREKKPDIYIFISCYIFLKYLNLFLSICYVLFVLKIEGIFGRKNSTQKCWKGSFFIYSNSINNDSLSVSFSSCLCRWDPGTLIIWLWKENTVRQLLCVPSYYEDQLRHGRGTTYGIPLFLILWGSYLVIECSMDRFHQMGLSLCTSASTSCFGSLHAYRKPQTTWYCLWG